MASLDGIAGGFILCCSNQDLHVSYRDFKDVQSGSLYHIKQQY